MGAKSIPTEALSEEKNEASSRGSCCLNDLKDFRTKPTRACFHALHCSMRCVPCCLGLQKELHSLETNTKSNQRNIGQRADAHGDVWKGVLNLSHKRCPS